MTTYDIGDAPRVTASFHNTDGVLTDPSTVTAEHVQPDGTQSTLAGVTNESTGVWWVNLPTITLAGTHVVKFFGTGTLVAAEEVDIVVRRTRVA